MNDTITKGLRGVADWYEEAMRRVSVRLGGQVAEKPAPAVASSDPSFFDKAELDDSFRGLAFTFAIIALGAKLAAADGEIKQEEFSAFCALFPMPNEEQPKIQRLFFLAHTDPNSFTHYAKQLLRLFPGQGALKEEVVRRLCRLAEADGRATLSEKRMLEGIAKELSVDVQVIHGTLTTSFTGKSTDPYMLLGVEPSATNAQVKQAYRNRMRELHPDRLTAEGFSAEDIAHAEAELMAVGEAYAALARKRKIK